LADSMSLMLAHGKSQGSPSKETPSFIPCPATREGRELFGISATLYSVCEITSSKSLAVQYKDRRCTRVLVKSSI
jgi:hypothetical protein